MTPAQHNITANIEKWRIDFEKGARIAQASDKVASPKYGKASPDAVARAANGRNSQELTGDNDFEIFVKGHDVALVNFYAPWCIWCKRLVRGCCHRRLRLAPRGAGPRQRVLTAALLVSCALAAPCVGRHSRPYQPAVHAEGSVCEGGWVGAVHRASRMEGVR